MAYVLETSHVAVAHTADNLCAELLHITDEWDIASKIVSIVTDKQ